MLKLFVLFTSIIGIINASSNHYCDFSSCNHTVCFRQAERCGAGSRCGPEFRVVSLNDSERQQILDYHNQLRNRVAVGNQTGQPSATNMRALSYNKELEFIAQCWVNECRGNPLVHDSCRRTSNYSWVGQNLAIVSDSTANFDEMTFILDLIQAWFDEVNVFDPSWASDGSWHHQTGHYTQMVWADTTEVGCAITRYSSYANGMQWHNLLLGCDYGRGGNIVGQPVYLVGPPASNCGSLGRNSRYPGLCGIDRSLRNTPNYQNELFGVNL
ncbi:unnamed protein product [Phaedon cochleariae]|uniref:SCP domain-containing protein n=1 Tax=Phaedon cochleariae TaxID=80249 RepID=A0A9P0GV48_PHACE|nr:unnamed protein product [Phaedon cochleariae]